MKHFLVPVAPEPVLGLCFGKTRGALLASCLALAALAATIAFPCSAADKLDGNGCGPFATALRLAMAEYGEEAAFIATTANGFVVTLTVNAKTGTWTMWGQHDAETMCLITGGEGWEPAPDAVKQVAPPGRPS
jgi:hypothetical protein